MDFDFKKETKFSNEIFERKKISENFFKWIPKMSNFRFNLNTSIHPGVWSIVALAMGITALHYSVPNAAWAIPVACILYYASTYAMPFAVFSLALGGMALGVPYLAFLFIFSIVTMIPWSKID